MRQTDGTILHDTDRGRQPAVAEAFAANDCCSEQLIVAGWAGGWLMTINKALDIIGGQLGCDRSSRAVQVFSQLALLCE